MKTRDFGQTLERDVAKFRNLKEAASQSIDQTDTTGGCLENEAKWNPIEETEEGFESGLDEFRRACRAKNLRAEVIDGGKLIAHALLELFGLGRSHLFGRKIKNLLRQKSQYDHVIFANCETAVASSNDLVDKGGPVMWPFLLQDGNEDEVELVQQGSLASKTFLAAGGLDDNVHHKIADS